MEQLGKRVPLVIDTGDTKASLPSTIIEFARARMEKLAAKGRSRKRRLTMRWVAKGHWRGEEKDLTQRSQSSEHRGHREEKEKDIENAEAQRATAKEAGTWLTFVGEERLGSRSRRCE